MFAREEERRRREYALALTSLHRIQSLRNSFVSNRQSFFDFPRKQEAVAAEDEEAEDLNLFPFGSK
jgi:hypothetical protein